MRTWRIVVRYGDKEETPYRGLDESSAFLVFQNRMARARIHPFNELRIEPEAVWPDGVPK